MNTPRNPSAPSQATEVAQLRAEIAELRRMVQSLVARPASGVRPDIEARGDGGTPCLSAGAEGATSSADYTYLISTGLAIDDDQVNPRRPWYSRTYTPIVSWNASTETVTIGDGTWEIQGFIDWGNVIGSPSLTWDNITDKPDTFPPSLHFHTISAITYPTASGQPATACGHAFSGEAFWSSSFGPVQLGWTSGTWTPDAVEVGAPLVIREQDIAFSGGSAGAAVSDVSNGQGIGWMGSVRKVSWLSAASDAIELIDDAVAGSDADPAMRYTPSATPASRSLEVLVKLTIVGAAADCVIDPALIDAAGKALALRELDVCDAGVAKKILVLCSEPYT